MDEDIVSAKKEVLIEMVKLAQKQGMVGSKGGWKDFLKFYDKKFGASVSDPARRSVDSLVAFLKTLTQENDLKFLKKVMQCHSNREAVETLTKSSPHNETPEQRLVSMTLGHPQYSIDYALPSYDEEWMVVKCSKKSKAMKSTVILAIDCEMVLCEDGTEALVRVCAVDRNLQVKLDVFVNPNKAIADYRTEITGISAKELDGVTYSLVDVQKSMKKLLSNGTILVGHSLNNDLQALKLEYTRIIDTSYVFKRANGPANKKPSLSLLCKGVLGYELRKEGSPHNCLDDACAAMKLVLARLEHGADGVIQEEVKDVDSAKLLLHRIPVNISTKDLQSVIPGDFEIELKTSKKVRDTYSAFAVFGNQKEANETFDNLQGNLEKDSTGRPQKVFTFELSTGIAASLCVCKMACDDSVDQGTLKKRSFEDEDKLGASKKSRKDQNCEQLEEPDLSLNKCEAHSKEIERLKQELRQRDQEISNLNKILVALTRKQGL
ncbi:small RNA degrading nuclease 1-like [Olea europaea subsp. europaea]|uniref:Small RNA degrading nuclease 1-like n=1 Tax=Olea europaea subsp. europaea TaxID=158383 RepID=A0A8S0RPM8_OLEEU|nr:small RNA degrading nuclease 1-like [Olea europaea subsp. europaea]